MDGYESPEKAMSDRKLMAVLWGMVAGILICAFAMGWFCRDKVEATRCNDATPLMDVTWKGKKTRIEECSDGSVRAVVAPFSGEIVTR
jgi:hypothetical protein